MNTDLPTGWRQLPYGECTIEGPTPSLVSAIGQDGSLTENEHTCNFDQFDSIHYP